MRDDQFAAHLGLQVDRIALGSAASSMVVAEEHLNPHGTAHGAFLYSLVGTALAAAANDDEHSGVVSAVLIDYLAPAHAGDHLIATASATERLAKEDIFTVRLVRVGDDGVIARASARATRRGVRTPTSPDTAPEP